MAAQLVVAIVTGLVTGIGSALLTNWLQHHFWKLQRAEEHRFWKGERGDELRLRTIGDFNQLTNAYVAACLAGAWPERSVEDWLRDLNTTGATLRVLFSESAYQAAKAIDGLIKPYADWRGPDRMTRAHAFSEACHVALTALYREVLETSGAPEP